MLIEPHKIEVNYDYGRHVYNVKLEITIPMANVVGMQECVYVYVKSNTDKCDMVCPTCGGSLSC